MFATILITIHYQLVECYLFNKIYITIKNTFSYEDAMKRLPKKSHKKSSPKGAKNYYLFF